MVDGNVTKGGPKSSPPVQIEMQLINENNDNGVQPQQQLLSHGGAPSGHVNSQSFDVGGDLPEEVHDEVPVDNNPVPPMVPPPVPADARPQIQPQPPQAHPPPQPQQDNVDEDEDEDEFEDEFDDGSDSGFAFHV